MEQLYELVGMSSRVPADSAGEDATHIVRSINSLAVSPSCLSFSEDLIDHLCTLRF